MYYSRFNSQSTKGKEAEEKFKEVALSKGLKVKKSSKKDDKMKHIDYYVTNKETKEVFSVDVKNKGSFGFTSEIQNNWGGTGSLFGEATYMCYVDTSFKTIYLINREKLVELVRSKITDTNTIYNSSVASSIEDPYYKLFQRQNYGYQDLWTMIPSHDIIPLAEMTWRY